MPPTKKLYGPHGVAHPAPFSAGVLELVATLLTDQHERVLDPFAGIGKIHELPELVDWPMVTLGVELEPEWAACHPLTKVGDATDLDLDHDTFDAIVTSPCYGNRMADSHKAADASVRRSYTHDLGRQLHDNNAGHMHWRVGRGGDAYRDLHTRAIVEMERVVKPGGHLVLNIKDHIRDKRRQYVTAWWVETLQHHGFRLVDSAPVETPGNRAGANRDSRVRAELVLMFELPE